MEILKNLLVMAVGCYCVYRIFVLVRRIWRGWTKNE